MQVMSLEERRRIRKTLTVASLKERLSACRKQKKQALLEKTKHNARQVQDEVQRATP
jgi:hypothetical protein